LAEHQALREAAGVLDLSFRGRICLTGADRVRFLHGQVTNDVKKLRAGEGCYSALTTAKGKMQSDLNIFCLQDELLLDFEPGLTATVTERWRNTSSRMTCKLWTSTPHYGLLGVQGPKAEIDHARDRIIFRNPGAAARLGKNFRRDARRGLPHEPRPPGLERF
jgi:glycine cleavage system aminomethyltransferase T